MKHIDKNNQLITVIESEKKWKIQNLKEMWQYKELMVSFINRDVKVRYRQTVMGVAWAILQPFLTMVVFSFFFGKLARISTGDIPYPVFSYSGLVLWSYFSSAVIISSNSVISYSGLLTKVYFPRIIVPMSATIAPLIDYLMALVVVGGLMFFFKTSLSPTVVLLPVVVGITYVLATSIGVWLSAINVKYRDVKYIVPFFLQLLMFISPVIYPSSVAERFKLVLWLNPLAGLLETHRALILGQTIPFTSLFLSLITTIVLAIFGIIYFKKTEDLFADYL